MLAVASMNGQLKIYMVGESKEQSMEQGKVKSTDQGKDNSADQSKDKSTDQGKDKSADQSKDKSTDQGKDKSMDQCKGKSTDEGKEKSTEQEQTRKPCKDSHLKDAEETLTKDVTDRDDKTQKDASSPKHQTCSQFTVTEIGLLWSERDDITIKNMVWSPQVCTRMCLPT